VINNASRNRPSAASTKISTVVMTCSGPENPSVNSEEPDSSSASSQPLCSIAQKIIVNPSRTRVSQVTSVAIRATGAYAPRRRSLRR